MDTTVLITDYDGKCCMLFAYCHSCICFLLVLMNMNRQKIRQNPQWEGRGRGPDFPFLLSLWEKLSGTGKGRSACNYVSETWIPPSVPFEHRTTCSEANFFSPHSPFLCPPPREAYKKWIEWSVHLAINLVVSWFWGWVESPLMT